MYFIFAGDEIKKVYGIFMRGETASQPMDHFFAPGTKYLTLLVQRSEENYRASEKLVGLRSVPLPRRALFKGKNGSYDL